MTARGRSAYNQLSSSDTEDLDLSQQPSDGRSHNVSRSQPSSGRRRNNNRVSYSPIQPSDDKDSSTASGTEIELSPISTTSPSLVDEMDESLTDSDAEIDDGNCVTVVVLDSAQNRFPIKVNPAWSVQKFKKVGTRTHKVPPQSQRLIFRGRMLDDSRTLKDMGITENDVIIHLFPKPRVVLTNSSSSREPTHVANSSTDHQSNEEGGGAHIPQIILDEEEQERRGQILVLGSHEITEAQNNIRMLSLLLGTMCLMRLLSLVSIASGSEEMPVSGDDFAPSEGGGMDDVTNHTTAPEYEVRSWENQDYFDLVVSSVGFYVARLGMKAAIENTSRLATQYLIGTLIAGILWNAWNVLAFVDFVREEEAPPDDDNAQFTNDEQLTSEDFRTIAMFTILMPLGVWVLCCARAYEFRHLIEEAELEAAQRIQSELTLAENQGSNYATEETTTEMDERSISSDRPTIV